MSSLKRGFAAAFLVGTLSLAGVACSSSSSSSGSFCDVAKKADSADLSPSDGKAFTEMLNKLKSSAPSEIKDDIATLADGIEQAQKDPTKLDEKKLSAANANIEKYLKDKCGIKINS